MVTSEAKRRRASAGGGDGGFPIVLGVISYQIRILLYRDVSCMYPVCILMCPVRIYQDTSRFGLDANFRKFFWK